MEVSLQGLSRAEAERLEGGQIKRGGWKARQWRFRWKGINFHVKDVRHSSPLYRWTVGRLLVRHEAAIYRRLGEVRFAPRCFGRLDADALLLEQVPAPSLGQIPKGQVDPGFFDRLEACLRELHARGIVHLDIRSRRNILLTCDGQPVLIDFANAVYVGEGWFSRRILLPLLAAIDHSAVLKFRHRDYPQLVTPAEQERYRRFRRWHRLWFFGRLWQWSGDMGFRPATPDHTAKRSADRVCDRQPHQAA